ncbi:PREDICTED: uncharacterized protein LOC107084646 [Cyprinodon variegatus]|uniref:uncharacterized protein LOC107084646 n=1 Tax=Cyprinodon variegatus TaxID=28743 RepID=UPI000742534F|nr:PREDICTED: uncharacterized protein LOC107084646 [Cyprinodon variegatus]
MKKAVQRPSQSLSEAEQQDLERYIEGISDKNQPATALDIHVLTQSDSLQGKGIRLIVVDEHESKLTEDYFPGKDSSAEDIVIRLRRYPDAPQQTQGFFSKMKKQARGEQTPQRGHFELVGADGSVIPVYSEGQNCLYHAVVQATQGSPSDLNQQALALRAQVQRTLQQDVQRYTPALRLQRQYEQTLAARSCYTISGGAKKEREQMMEAYQQMLNRIRINNPELYQLMKTYKLGLVGAYQDVIGVRRESGSPNNNGDPVMNADHIPPRDCLQKAYDILQQKGRTEAFRTEHPALYNIMVQKDKQLCREVLAQHHRMALTTGNSREARSTRAELTKVLLSGDSVKLMKMSLLLSNPEVSESLRRDAGISRKQVMGNDLSGEEIQVYHEVGNRLLVDGYSASGLFTNNQREELQDWLDRGQLYSKETAEYQQLLAAIGDANNKKQPKKNNL